MERTDRIRIFCSELWQWFSVHKRQLPWRDLNIKDPNHRAYRILVSEVMLQQTQVPRVIILYKKFIQTFPRIEDLAKASNREVLIAWRGMGYNSRALRLRDAARAIVTRSSLTRCSFEKGKRETRNEHTSNEFPRQMDELLALPGIGHFTASAIRNFAFGLPTPCLDTNIRRILHRFFVGMEKGDGTWRKNDRQLLKLAEQILEIALAPPPLAPPPGSAEQPGEGKARVISLPADDERAIASESSRGRDRERGRGEMTAVAWHSALMDFGSLVCTKSNPKWKLLPIGMRSICKAYGAAKKRRSRVPKVVPRIKREPGREVAGRFVPNRIFRGRIVDALRDASQGLTLDQLGKAAIADWTMGDHRKWLSALIEKLTIDQLVTTKGRRLKLKD